MAIVFAGKAYAQQGLAVVRQAVAARQQRQGFPVAIRSIFPYEDEASVLYSQLKQADAGRVGMQYQLEPLSLRAPRQQWLQAIQRANRDPLVQGLLVQKPSAARYAAITNQPPTDFYNWWTAISESIALDKDIDGLHPFHLQKLEQASAAVQSGHRPPADHLQDWILPATAQAVINIIQEAVPNLVELRQMTVVMVGRSYIVGTPVAYGLRLLGVPVTLISSHDDLAQCLSSANIVVTATGQAGMIKASWLRPSAILVDVGAPRPEFQPSCYELSRFYTPVPGGVGPVTRLCLLQNVLKIIDHTENTKI